MELCGNQQVVMLVRGAHRNLEEPIAGVLRLIIHQLQSGFEAASAQSALKRAEHRIRSLEQALGLKQTSVLAPAPPPSKRHLAEAMRKFAEGNWQRPIQLRDVASALNMNPSYLCGLFSQCTGTTFHAYLETLRLTKARELLRDPARRVQEVAFSVGFSSGAHFCRVFKVRNGLSPRAWRAMHTSGVTGAAE